MIIIVRKCKDCPFLSELPDVSRCNISTPPRRPLHELDERPSFCPLRREQAIVREFDA